MIASIIFKIIAWALGTTLAGIGLIELFRRLEIHRGVGDVRVGDVPRGTATASGK